MLALSLALLFAPLEVIDLTVEGPACIDHDKVMEATARYLGRADIDELETKILARVEVRESKAGFEVEIHVELPAPHLPSDRELDAATCEEAIDIAGLIISVALDPVAVSREVEPKGEPEKSEAEKAEATSLPKPETLPQEPLPRSLGELSALAHLGIGQYETPTWGTSLGFDYTRRPLLRVGIFGRYWGPRLDPLPDAPEAGIRLQSVVAGVRACVAPTYKTWTFPSCVAFEGGVLLARGHGLERNDLTRLPLLALGVEQMLSWRFHPRVSLLLSLGTGLQLVRPRVQIDDIGTVFTRPALSFRAGVGPALHF